MLARYAARAAPAARIVPTHRLRAFSTSHPARFIEENVSADRLAQLLEENQTSGKPLLVDFFADWCQPCKMLSPIIHRIASTPSLVGGREVDLVTLDVDQNMDAAMQFKVGPRPTLTPPRCAPCRPSWPSKTASPPRRSSACSRSPS